MEFVSNSKKRTVLQNCNKLKGKNISISQDLTPLQRRQQKILRKHLILARQEGKYTDCFIRGNKLIVDGTTFEVEDLEEKENLENKLSGKPASAPDTPVAASVAEVFSVARVLPVGTPKLPVIKKANHSNHIGKQVQDISGNRPKTRSLRQ